MTGKILIFVNATADRLIKEVKIQCDLEDSLENHVRLIHIWEEISNSANTTSADQLMSQLLKLVCAFNVTSVNISEFYRTTRHHQIINVFQFLIEN